MARWKNDYSIFGMNPPSIGGLVTKYKGKEYYVGIWEGDEEDKYEVVLGRFERDEDVIIRGKRNVTLPIAKKWYKYYKDNFEKIVR